MRIDSCFFKPSILWSFVTGAQGKGLQASFHQVAESKLQLTSGNSINSCFLGRGLSSGVVMWCLRVGAAGRQPALEHLPAWTASSEGPYLTALGHSLAGGSPGSLCVQAFCSFPLTSDMSLAPVGHGEVLGFRGRMGPLKSVTTFLLSLSCGHSTVSSLPWAFS